MTVFLYYLRPDAELENGGWKEKKGAQRRANAGLMLMLTVQTALDNCDRFEKLRAQSGGFFGVFLHVSLVGGLFHPLQ